jgi:hypothetical protein
MPTIQILVRVEESFGTDVPDPPGQGHRFIFSDNLVLERYDDSTPGNGLPLDPKERRAGTQSGFLTVVRVAATGDHFFPEGSELWQYEGTYKFNALDDTPLQKGQVTARGVVLFEGDNVVDPPVRFAITGGTGPYSTAHGTITEGVPEGDHRLLDIEL